MSLASCAEPAATSGQEGGFLDEDAVADGWTLAIDSASLDIWADGAVQETASADQAGGTLAALLVAPTTELRLELEVSAPLAEIAVLVPGVDPTIVAVELDGAPAALEPERTAGSLTLSAPAPGIYAITLRSAEPLREVAVLAIAESGSFAPIALAERGLPMGAISAAIERSGAGFCPADRWAGPVGDAARWLDGCAEDGGVPASSGDPAPPPAGDADGDGVATGTDCDDTNASIGAPQTWWYDNDNDLYGDPATPYTGCTRPYRYRTNNLDCDDTNSSVKPKATEVCTDGIDTDCDGSTNDADATDAKTWWYDYDYDFYGNPAAPFTGCNRPVRYRTNSQDCDDTDAAIKPGATEVADAKDNDCDGVTDEGFLSDGDGDGYDASYDCDDTNPAINPDATEMCDSVDNDCDGTIDESDAADAPTWYRDADNDLYGDPATSVQACTRPVKYRANNLDCNDASSAIKPKATEVADGVDNDCDGLIDEA